MNVLTAALAEPMLILERVGCDLEGAPRRSCQLEMEVIMPYKLDRKYVEDHLGAHNYESFGRSIVAAVLEEALEQMSDQDSGFEGEFKFEVETTLEATPSGCTWVIMIVNGRRVRIHQPPITSFPLP